MEKLEEKQFYQIMKEVSDFFEVTDISKPKIGFIYSRGDFDKLLGRKTERWERAVSKEDGIYFIHSSMIEELTNHTNADLWQVVKHEIVHWFYGQITNTHNPKWFNEGLANVIAEAKRGKPRKLNKPVIEKYFDNSDADNYSWGYWMVKYLLDSYGKEVLVDLVKAMAGQPVTKELFEQKFNQSYPIELEDLQNLSIEKYFGGKI